MFLWFVSAWRKFQSQLPPWSATAERQRPSCTFWHSVTHVWVWENTPRTQRLATDFSALRAKHQPHGNCKIFSYSRLTSWNKWMANHTVSWPSIYSHILGTCPQHSQRPLCVCPQVLVFAFQSLAPLSSHLRMSWSQLCENWEASWQLLAES